MGVRKGIFLFVMICLIQGMTGCSIYKEDETKIKDVEYTVVASQDVPKEMEINENSKEPFEVTYADQGYLYASFGYGEQKSSGYSILVESCYESENTIFIKTRLKGPKKGEKIIEKPTCPYIVLKMEYNEKEVVFQ